MVATPYDKDLSNNTGRVYLRYLCAGILDMLCILVVQSNIKREQCGNTQQSALYHVFEYPRDSCQLDLQTAAIVKLCHKSVWYRLRTDRGLI